MIIEQLLTNNATLLHQQVLGGYLLEVKETSQYRWFEYDGASIQSLMSKAAQEKVIMPVSQSLLLFLLLENNPTNILSLGLGGASIERALVAIPNIKITAIDASQPIIDMARRYFYLPNSVEVYCQQAEQFVEETTIQYDVVLCDLFIGEKNPEFLFTELFYKQLSQITSCKAVVSLNIKAQNNEQLLNMLFTIKKYFPNIVLIEFEDYSNIVIICSYQTIPNQTILQQRLLDFTGVDLSGLDRAIEKMSYIPSRGQKM